MALKKRDFQKIAQQVQEFLGKLACEEGTADLRDALNLALLYTQRYYKALRSRSHSNNLTPGSEHRSLCGTLLFTSSCGAVSPVSPACAMHNQFEWKWYNLESPKLSASLGTSEFSSISPFLQAARTGDAQVLGSLIDEDPESVNSVDGLGRNGLMYTVHGNTPAHLECLELILEKTQHNIDHQANDFSTALHVAAHENNRTALKLLLQNKASCSIEDNEGRTALHWAAANPSVDNLKLLVQHGADIRVNDCEGLTPAMWACHFDQLKNLTVLQSALSRVDPREEALYEETDLKGKTVVHWAVNKTGSTECLKALLTKESGLLYDNEKKSILHTAAEQGVLAACQLVLDVCGDECLSMTDSKGRTPLHLAALCGHAEILMFLLDRGADLSARDNNGLTVVDVIKDKHLYYCMMVLSLTPQYQKLYSDQNNNASGTISPHLEASDELSHRKCSPSAPPAFKVLGDAEPAIESGENHRTDKVNHAVFHKVDAPIRRKSEATNTRGEPPKPQPRRSRKQSAPAKLTPEKSQEDPQELQQRGEFKNFGYSIENTKEKQAPVRRQSLLMRQDGIQEEPAQPGTLRITSFDLGTEDGSVILIGDIDNLKASSELLDLNDDVLEIDCDNKLGEEEENFGYSSADLAEGRGSASSAKSELDHADNCSISAEMSVSSIGSDNDEREFIDTPDRKEEAIDNTYGPKSTSPERKVNILMKGSGQHMYPSAPPNKLSIQKTPHPPQSTRQIHHEQQHKDTSFHPELILENTGKETKKKKEKKKKKDSSNQGPSSPAVGPPHGVIAPLEPPSLSPIGMGPSKLGGMNGIVVKPGPWEHASLGLLRRGSPESPRFGAKPPYQSSEEFDEMCGQREFDSFDRPRTPEPPRCDVMTKPLYHPTPPGVRSQVEERDLYGVTSGHGSHNQALLRNTEMMMRGPFTGKNDSRGIMGNTMPRSKSPQMTAFSLHGGPVPHPPQR